MSEPAEVVETGSGGLRGGGPRVAVTRSTEDNRSLVGHLVERGYEVVEVPLIEVVEASDGGRALDAALAELTRYRWVVLTSVNGVRAVAARWAEGPMLGPWPDSVAVAAVGPVTAQAATDAELPVALVPDRATAASLVEAFPVADGRSNRVLAPLAELAGTTIEDGLAPKGWSVDRVEAYRTMAPTPPSDGGAGLVVRPGEPVDVIAFFSPSVVDRWVDRFGSGGPGQTPVAVCVGPSTAARAQQRGFPQVVIAEPHTEDGVIGAIEAHGWGGDVALR